tara:strand:- start:414 stop:749 length:336 start_codon:yes stop_codon:yes gene_type:complete
MNDLINNSLQILSKFDNTGIFAFSLFPYLAFLYFIWKNKKLNYFIKTGFSLTILFVLITIIFAILSNILYDKTLVEVDSFHGAAESLLTLSDLVILYGFLKLFKESEVKNS